MSSNPTRISARERLIVALDVPTLEEALKLADELREHVGYFKVGLELYASLGTRILDAMRSESLPIFFDCKLHDIPNTVASASRCLVDKGISMFNLHAAGGEEMLTSAVKATQEAAKQQNTKVPKIIAVTVLTSINQTFFQEEFGAQKKLTEIVKNMAVLSKKCGLDGVVASAQEAQLVRESCGKDFLIVTPGIRPSWSATDDQVRITTPEQALRNGADYLVVGRPITKAKDRADAARRVVAEMETAL